MKSHYTLERLDNFEHIWKTAKLELHTLINARFDCFASLSLLLCAYQLSTVRLSAPKPFHIVEDGSGESLVVTARANFDCPPPKSDGAQAFCLNGKVPVKYARVEYKKFSGIWPGAADNCSCLNFAQGPVLGVKVDL